MRACLIPRRRAVPTALMLALGVATAHAQGTTVAYPHEPTTVVVSLVEVLGEIGEADAGPSLEIYGDGRTAVHYPVYMKRAGNYTGRLSRAELDTLVQSLVDGGIPAFDAGAVRSAKRAAAARRAAGATLSVSSDPSVVTITLRTGAGESRVAWVGLRADAREHPDIEAIRNLAAAHGRLQAVMERPDLTRVD
jgi:hypothetical protein